jgi:hypothetical protein
MKKLIYIAGPYTHPDPVENTHRAIKKGDEFIARGYSVFIPHLTLLWHIVTPRPAQFWYDYTLEILAHCDVLYRMLGESYGADMEVEFAKKNNIPIIYEPTVCSSRRRANYRGPLK